MVEPTPINSWSTILRGLPLSRAEHEIVRRFETEPEGRTFLPVADILKAHKLVDEALELLTQGVDLHPQFTAARVVLARELLAKGMVEAAWRVLYDSPLSLDSNVLAQKIKLKSGLLLSFETEVNSTIAHLDAAKLHDPETKTLADLIKSRGQGSVREKLIAEMREKGVDPLLPSMSPSGEMYDIDLDREEAALKRPERMAIDQTKPSPFDAVQIPPTESDYLDTHLLQSENSIQGFHVISLEEIFRPEHSTAADLKVGGGVEMDSTTLAEIYAGQGLFLKALQMYRRLLRTSPKNDFIKRRIAELSRMERDQKSQDLTIDPGLVNMMETIEIIDRQIKFYSHLLTKLS